jgi:hypothetical protein
MMEHPHTHETIITCDGDECGNELHEKYSHTHEEGHSYHTHKPEGMKLIKEVKDDDKTDPPSKDNDPHGIFA